MILRVKFSPVEVYVLFLGLHLGVDNLGVVRHVGRLLMGHHGSLPFELVKDGDLLLLIEKMLHGSDY